MCFFYFASIISSITLAPAGERFTGIMRGDMLVVAMAAIAAMPRATATNGPTDCASVVFYPANVSSGPTAAELAHTHVEDPDELHQSSFVQLAPWSSWSPPTIPDCPPDGQIDRSQRRWRTGTMHTGFVPGLTYTSISQIDPANTTRVLGRLSVCYDSPSTGVVNFTVLQEGLTLAELDLQASGRPCIIPTDFTTPAGKAFGEEHPAHRYRTVIGSGVVASSNYSEFGVHHLEGHIRTSSNRLLCVDSEMGLVGVHPDIAGSSGVSCDWLFGEVDAATKLQTLTSGNTQLLAHIESNPEDSDSLLYGDGIKFVGGDLRLRQLKETATVFSEPDPETTFHESVQLSTKVILDSGYLDQADESRFVPPNVLRATRRNDTVMLQGLPASLANSSIRSSVYPVWSAADIAPIECPAQTNIDPSFFVPDEEPATCHAHVELLQTLQPGTRHSFVVTTARFSVEFGLSFPPVAQISLGQMGDQVVVDFTDDAQFRVELTRGDSDTAHLSFWLAVPDTVACTQAVLHNQIEIWREDTPLDTSAYTIDAYDAEALGVVTSSVLCPLDLATPPASLSLCAVSPRALACGEQAVQMSGLRHKRQFVGTLHELRFWRRRLAADEGEISLLANYSNVISLWQSVDADKRMFQAGDALADLEWALACRPDILPVEEGADTVLFANAHGGVRCVASSTAKPGQEIDFVPTFHCHEPECTGSTPYKCTDGRCYDSPGACELLSVAYNCSYGLHKPMKEFSANEWTVFQRSRETVAANAIYLQCARVGYVACAASSADAECSNYVIPPSRPQWDRVIDNEVPFKKEWSCDKDELYALYDLPDDICQRLQCVPDTTTAIKTFEVGASGQAVTASECEVSCYEVDQINRLHVYTHTPIGNSSLCACYSKPPEVWDKIESPEQAHSETRTCTRSLQLQWHKHALCPELQSVLDTDASAALKASRLSVAVDALVDRAVGSRMPMAMKVPQRDGFNSAAAQITSVLDVERPLFQQPYPVPGAEQHTVVAIVDPRHQRNRRGEPLPMHLATQTGYRLTGHHSLDLGSNCFRLSVPESTVQLSAGLSRSDQKLCSDGPAGTSEDDVCASRGAYTLLCGSSKPFMCASTRVFQYPRPEDVLSKLHLFVNRLGTATVNGHKVHAIQTDLVPGSLPQMHSSTSALVDGHDAWVVRVQIGAGPNDAVAAIKRSTHRVKSAEGLSACEVDSTPSNQCKLKALDELVSQGTDLLTLYFTHQAVPGDRFLPKALEFGIRSAPWTRVVPAPGGTDMPTRFVTVNGDTDDTPMTLLLCGTSSGAVHWMMYYYSYSELEAAAVDNRLHELINADCVSDKDLGAAWHWPMELGVSSEPEHPYNLQTFSLSPFNYIKDWSCKAHVDECEPLQDVEGGALLRPCSSLAPAVVAKINDLTGFPHKQVETHEVVDQVTPMCLKAGLPQAPIDSTKPVLAAVAPVIYLSGWDHPYASGSTAPDSGQLGTRPELLHESTTVSFGLKIYPLPDFPDTQVVFDNNPCGGGGVTLDHTPQGGDTRLVYSFGQCLSPTKAAYQNTEITHQISVEVPVNRFVHVAIVRDLANEVPYVKIYLNGTVAQQSILPQGTGVANTLSPFRIGKGLMATADANLLLRDFAVWTRVIDETRIRALTAAAFVPRPIDTWNSALGLHNMLTPQDRHQFVQGHQLVFDGIYDGIYAMPSIAKGTTYVTLVQDEGSNEVYWTDCGETLGGEVCLFGTKGTHNDTFGEITMQSDSLAVYKTRVDLWGNLWIPTQQGIVQAQRLKTAAMRECEFANPNDFMECDTACACAHLPPGETCRCKGNCDDTDSVFRLKFTLRNECVTMATPTAARPESIYVAACSPVDTVTQLFKFRVFNASHAQLQSLNSGNPCVFVHSSTPTLGQASFLAVDYECKHWVSVLMLRRAVLVDSDHSALNSEVLFNTIADANGLGFTAAFQVRDQKVVYQSTQSVKGEPLSFPPRLFFGNDTSPRSNVFELPLSSHGEGQTVFGANRPPLDNDHLFVPARGILKTRNWDVVHNNLSYITAAPAGNWRELAHPPSATDSRSMLAISQGEVLRTFVADSGDLCRRLCELSELCRAASHSPRSADPSGPVDCVHGTERHSVEKFHVNVNFKANRTRNLRETVQLLKANLVDTSWTQNVVNGPVDQYTQQLSLLARRLHLQPAHVNHTMRDDSGRLVQHVCLPSDNAIYPDGAFEATSFRVLENSFYYKHSNDTFTVQLVPVEGPAIAECAWSLGDTNVGSCSGPYTKEAPAAVTNGDSVSLPPSCIARLAPNKTYSVVAKRLYPLPEERFVGFVRYHHCWQARAPALPLALNATVDSTPMRLPLTHLQPYASIELDPEHTSTLTLKLTKPLNSATPPLVLMRHNVAAEYLQMPADELMQRASHWNATSTAAADAIYVAGTRDPDLYHAHYNISANKLKRLSHGAHTTRITALLLAPVPGPEHHFPCTQHPEDSNWLRQVLTTTLWLRRPLGQCVTLRDRTNTNIDLLSRAKFEIVVWLNSSGVPPGTYDQLVNEQLVHFSQLFLFRLVAFGVTIEPPNIASVSDPIGDATSVVFDKQTMSLGVDRCTLDGAACKFTVDVDAHMALPASTGKACLIYGTDPKVPGLCCNMTQTAENGGCGRHTIYVNATAANVSQGQQQEVAVSLVPVYPAPTAVNITLHPRVLNLTVCGQTPLPGPELRPFLSQMPTLVAPVAGDTVPVQLPESHTTLRYGLNSSGINVLGQEDLHPAPIASAAHSRRLLSYHESIHQPHGSVTLRNSRQLLGLATPVNPYVDYSYRQEWMRCGLAHDTSSTACTHCRGFRIRYDNGDNSLSPVVCDTTWYHNAAAGIPQFCDTTSDNSEWVKAGCPKSDTDAGTISCELVETITTGYTHAAFIPLNGCSVHVGFQRENHRYGWVYQQDGLGHDRTTLPPWKTDPGSGGGRSESYPSDWIYTLMSTDPNEYYFGCRKREEVGGPIGAQYSSNTTDNIIDASFFGCQKPPPPPPPPPANCPTYGLAVNVYNDNSGTIPLNDILESSVDHNVWFSVDSYFHSRYMYGRPPSTDTIKTSDVWAAGYTIVSSLYTPPESRVVQHACNPSFHCWDGTVHLYEDGKAFDPDVHCVRSYCDTTTFSDGESTRSCTGRECTLPARHYHYRNKAVSAGGTEDCEALKIDCMLKPSGDTEWDTTKTSRTECKPYSCPGGMITTNVPGLLLGCTEGEAQRKYGDTCDLKSDNKDMKLVLRQNSSLYHCDTTASCVGSGTSDWTPQWEGIGCYRNYCNVTWLDFRDTYDDNGKITVDWYDFGRRYLDGNDYDFVRVGQQLFSVNGTEEWYIIQDAMGREYDCKVQSQSAPKCLAASLSRENAHWETSPTLTTQIDCNRRDCMQSPKLILQNTAPPLEPVELSVDQVSNWTGCNQRHTGAICGGTGHAFVYNGQNYECEIATCRYTQGDNKHAHWGGGEAGEDKLNCYRTDCIEELEPYATSETGHHGQVGKCANPNPNNPNDGCKPLQTNTSCAGTPHGDTCRMDDAKDGNVTYLCPPAKCTKDTKDLGAVASIKGHSYWTVFGYDKPEEPLHTSFRCYHPDAATCPPLQLYYHNGTGVHRVSQADRSQHSGKPGYLSNDCTDRNDDAIGARCTPQVRGYSCPSIECQWDVGRGHALWLELVNDYGYNKTTPILYVNGGERGLEGAQWASEHKCFQNPAPTTAPTMSFPLSKEDYRKAGVSNMSEIGFRCGADPFIMTSGLEHSHCTPRPKEVQSFCHPTQAALEGRNDMYQWSACPVHGGCPAGKACMFGRDEISTGENFFLSDPLNDSNERNNWYNTYIHVKRCGCQEYNYSTDVLWHNSPSAHFPYCSTKAPAGPTECRYGAKQLARRGNASAVPMAPSVEPIWSNDTSHPHIPYGCSSVPAMVRTRSSTECFKRSFPKHFTADIVDTSTTASATVCKAKCAVNHNCVQWVWWGGPRIPEFDLTREIFSTGYMQVEKHRMETGECRLLSFYSGSLDVFDVFGSVDAKQLFSGDQLCVTEKPACDDSEVTVASLEACDRKCMTNPLCEAVSFESTNNICKVYECGAEATSELFPDVYLSRKGLQAVFRYPPIGAVDVQLMRTVGSDPGKEPNLPVCQGGDPPFFPQNAGDQEVTNHRSAESCPSNYAEISTRETCAEAGKFITGGMWNFSSVQDRNCLLRPDIGSSYSDSYPIGLPITDLKEVEECELMCHEHHQCTAFFFAPPLPNLPDNANTTDIKEKMKVPDLEATASYDHRPQSELLQVHAIPLKEIGLRATLSIDGKRQTGYRQKMCAHYCYKLAECEVFVLTNSHVCQLFNKGSNSNSVQQVIGFEITRNTDYDRSTCVLYRHCAFWQKTTPITNPEEELAPVVLRENLVSYSLLRHASPVKTVDISKAMSVPPGCFLWTEKGISESVPTLHFNEHRNFLSWVKGGNPHPHELLSEATAETATYDESGVCPTGLSDCTASLHRRVCVRTTGLTYDSGKELGSTFRTLDYGKSSDGASSSIYKGKGVDWEYFTGAGADKDVEYALASRHGVSCAALTGYTSIIAPRQCKEAAKASNLVPRKEALYMDFAGTRWYLVRRVAGGQHNWHEATDDLQGLDVYGDYEANATSRNSFSIYFGRKHTKLLLATGDMSSWIVLPKDGGCLGRDSDKLLASECGNLPSENQLDNETLLEQCQPRWYPPLANSSVSGSPPMAMACSIEFPGVTDPTKVNMFDPKIVLSTTAVGTASNALPGETLYAEARLFAAANAKYPLHDSGANVWVDAMPNDGFVSIRNESVPGCSLDTPLASATVQELREADAAWHSPGSQSDAMQFGDNLVNFNPNHLMSEGESMSGSHFDEVETALFLRGDSWLRGRSLCVKKQHRMIDWFKAWGDNDQSQPAQKPAYLLGQEQGWQCPTGYQPVQAQRQCAEAFNAFQLHLTAHVNGNRSTAPVSGGHFKLVSATAFTELPQVLGRVDSYLSGCLVLPMYGTGDVGDYGEEATWNQEYNGWHVSDRKWTYNPLIEGEFRDTLRVPRTFEAEGHKSLRPHPQGYPVCALVADPPAHDDQWYTAKMQYAAKRLLHPVTQLTALTHLQLIDATVTLYGDVTFEALSGVQQSALHDLMLTTLQWVVEGGTDGATSGELVHSVGSIGATTQRRLLGQGLEVAFTLRLERRYVGAVLAALSSKMQNGATGFLEQLLVRAGLTTHADLTVLGSLTSSVATIKSVKDVSGAWTLAADNVDISLETQTQPIDRTMWWEAECECSAEGGHCGEAQMKAPFFRVSSGVVSAIDSTGWKYDSPQWIPTVTETECVHLCAEDLACVLALFSHHTPEEAKACALFERYETLLELGHGDPTGRVGVFVKPNSCSKVILTDIQICHVEVDRVGDSTGETPDNCLDLSADHQSERNYLLSSQSTASFSIQKRPLATPTTEFVLSATGPAPLRASPLCWAQKNNTLDPSENDKLLCRDGSAVPFLKDSENTDECKNASATVDGRHGQRLLCPFNFPYMCKFRARFESDYRCTDNPEECANLGGLRACTWASYELLGLPAFERIPYNSSAVTTTSVLDTGFASQLKIDSVSRCGPSWVQNASHVHVVIRQGICATGFACCDQPMFDAPVASHCSCPALADAGHLELHNGAFAGACDSKVRQWPMCAQQCAAMGSKCQYMLRQPDDSCLLCFAGKNFTTEGAAANWTYHAVQVPLLRIRPEVEDIMAHDAGVRFAFRPADGQINDATTAIEKGWFAFVPPSYKATCPSGYSAVVPVTATANAGEEDAAFRECTNALSALRHTRHSDAVFGEVVAQLSNSVNRMQPSASNASDQVNLACDCRYAAGCSLVHEFQGADSPVPIGLLYRDSTCDCTTDSSQLLGESIRPMTVCQQATGSSDFFVSEWRRCSVECSVNGACSHWAFDTATQRCVLYDLSTNKHIGDLELQMPHDIDLPVAAPFGNDWFGGKQKKDKVELFERMVDFTHVRVYTGAMSEADVARMEYELVKFVQQKAFALDGLAGYTSSVSPSQSYYRMQSEAKGERPTLTQQISHQDDWVWALQPFTGVSLSPRPAFKGDVECSYPVARLGTGPDNRPPFSTTHYPGALGAGDEVVRYLERATSGLTEPWAPGAITQQLGEQYYTSLWLRPEHKQQHVDGTSTGVLLLHPRSTTLQLGPSLVLVAVGGSPYLFKISLTVQLPGDRVGHRVFEHLLVADKWQHLSVVVDLTVSQTAHLYVMGILQESHQLQVRDTVDFLRQPDPTRPHTSIGALSPDPALAGVTILGAILVAEVYPEDAFRQSLHTRECTHTLSFNDAHSDGVAGVEKVRIMNPGHDIDMAMVSSSTTGTYMALADEQTPTYIRFQVGDCERQQLVHNATYSLEAVFARNIESPMAFQTELRQGTFRTRWLSAIEVSDSSHQFVPHLQTAAEVGHPPKWRARQQPDGAWHFIHDGHSTHAPRMQVELELDTDTTHADVYRLHAQEVQHDEESALVLQPQRDLDIKLLSDPSYHLLGGRCISCHGNCSLFTGTSHGQSHPFTLVRRISRSDESVGGLTDQYFSPKGEIGISPVVFTNGSEMHILDTTGCLPGGRNIVSQFTGRCIGRGVYANCAELPSADRCWNVSFSVVPHDDVPLAGQRTLAFDDSGLPPTYTVVAPPRALRDSFLLPDTVTDVSFDVRINANATVDVPADRITTPMRMYAAKGVVALPTQCYATSGQPSVEIVCNSLCTGPLSSVCDGYPTFRCTDTCFPRVVGPPSQSTSPAVVSIDLEVQRLTSGYSLKKKEWAVTEIPARCLAAGVNVVDTDSVQLAGCNLDGAYFDLVPVSTEKALAGKGQFGQFYAKSVMYNRCLGTSNDTLRLIPCLDYAALVHIVHTFRDDGGLYDGPTAPLMQRDLRPPEGLFRYEAGAVSVSLYLHRQEGGGTIRAIADFGPAASGQPYATRLVSLVHSSMTPTRLSDTHRYLLRIRRVNNGAQETTTAVFFCNGTVVDRRTWTVAQNASISVSQPKPTRSTVFGHALSPFSGILNNVDMRCSHTDSVNLESADSAQLRFGSGTRFRLYRQDRMHVLKQASQCADLCTTAATCAAARWSETTKICELLDSCNSISSVCEGRPNSFNLLPDPCYIFDNTPQKKQFVLANSTLMQLLPLLPENQRSFSSDDGSVRIQTGSQDPTATKTRIELQQVPTLAFMPQASTLFPAAPGQGPITQRRLLATGHNAWMATLNRLYDDGIVPNQVHGTYGHNPSVNTPTPPLPGSTPDGFPKVLQHATDETTDLVCSDARTFAFAGTFNSVNQRFGYRSLLSGASDGGTSGVSLLLTPHGNLLNKRSDVSVGVQGSPGCVNIIVISCTEDVFRVSVNGKLEYARDNCPFVVEAAETVMNAFVGRREALCFAGDISDIKIIELVGYLSHKHAANGENMCREEDTSVDSTLVANRFRVLPEKMADAGPVPDSFAFKVHTHINESTTLQCMDKQLCKDAYELYKVGTRHEAANPFRIAQAFRTPQETTVSLLGDGALFRSDVDLEAEERACGIHGVEMSPNAGDVYFRRNTCLCTDEGYYEWKEHPEQDPYLYDNCGECEYAEESCFTHPLQTAAMTFNRSLGTRKAKYPNRGDAGRTIQWYRELNPRTGGCEYPKLNDTEFRSCPPCPKDCSFQCLTPASLAKATSPGAQVQCPSEKQNCGLLEPTQCVFERRIANFEADGGRDCVTVHKEDMLEIARHDQLQGFRRAAPVLELSDRAIYFASENYSYYGSFYDSSLGQHTPVLNVSVQQRELYPFEKWNWLSVDVQMALQTHRVQCPAPCNALHCDNVYPSPEHSEVDVHDNRSLDTENTAFLAVIVVVVALVLVMAGFAYFASASCLEWCKSKADRRYASSAEKAKMVEFDKI